MGKNDFKRRCVQNGPLCVFLLALLALHVGLFWLIQIPSYRQSETKTLYITSTLSEEDSFSYDKGVLVSPLATREPLESSLIDHHSAISWSSNADISLWWHALPDSKRLAATEYEENAKVFWRGEVAFYALEAPIKAKHRGASACTLRYRVQVDLAHGRLLCIEPIEEQAEEDVLTCVHAWLWQQRFSCQPEKGIISGEVELCFGGEYG